MSGHYLPGSPRRMGFRNGMMGGNGPRLPWDEQPISNLTRATIFGGSSNPISGTAAGQTAPGVDPETGMGWQPGADIQGLMATLGQPADASRQPMPAPSDPAAAILAQQPAARRTGMLFGGVVPNTPPLNPGAGLTLDQGPLTLPPAKGSGLFAKGGPLGDGSALRAALLGFIGGPQVSTILAQRKQQEREEAIAERRYQRDRADHLDDRDYDANKPQYFMSGEDRWRYDPMTGKSEVVADAPQAFEEYAHAMGYEPGSPEYRRAMSDWVLRASGPTATDNDLTLERERYGNRVGLEGYRQQNRLAVRGTPTWRQSNPMPKAAPRPRAGGPAGQRTYKQGDRLANAKGEMVELRGNQWVPVK